MPNNRTKNLPGAVGVGDGGGIIKLDDVTNTQGRTIPNATAKNSGVMTKTQAAQLAALVAGGGGGGGPFVIANTFPGADIGEKINNACASIPQGGVVYVLDGDYVQTTKVVVETDITLWLNTGTISNAFPESATPPWLLKDNANLVGAGFGTKLMNPICSTIVCIAVSDFISASDNALVGNKNIVVRDIQFIGNPLSTAPAESAAVQFGNIKNVLVDHCWFNGVEGFGVFQASSSVDGNHGDGFVVRDCTFDNITTQQCGVINCINWQIRGNTFRPTTTITNYTVIDCEMNTGADVLRNFEIVDNILDLSTSPIFNPGSLIQVTGASVIPYSPTGRATNGLIAHNICIAGSQVLDTFIGQGINLNLSDYVTVADNDIRYANIAIEIAECNSCVLADNTTGTAGNNEAWHILVGDSFDCTIRDNKCVENNGQGHSTPNIAESGASDYNTFAGNWLNFYPYAVPNPGTDRYAKITTLGTHSVVLNSVLGQQPTPVDAPLIPSIAALRALDPPGDRAGSAAVVSLGGYVTQGDGGASVWTYDPTSAAVDNGVTVVVPHYRPGATGAWLRAPNQIHIDTVARDALVLTAADAGFAIWNTTTSRLETWTGAAWIFYNASAA